MNDTTLPALLTAFHLTLAIVRRHRAAGRRLFSPFVLPSFFFVAVPWVWPTSTGLALGAAVHLAWYLLCETVAPARTVAAPARQATTRPPASTPVPTRPSFVPAAVLAVIDEATDIRTFRVARPDGYDFVAGQFLPIRISIDGKPHVRCYSISSAPHVRGYLEISVRRQGLVSGTLHATVRTGTTLAIGRPAGQFVYPAGDERPLALIAGGIGITPLLSMLRHAIAADPARPVTLLYSARRQEDLAFQRELRVIVERHPAVRVAVTLTRPTEASRTRTGRVDAEMLRQCVASPAHTVFCICGPGPMIDESRQLLKTLGVPDSQVRYEQFEMAVAASQLSAAASAPTASAPKPSGQQVQVTFQSSGLTSQAQMSQTLLETAEASGVAIASSCRSGVCQSCRTRLHSGDADCRSDVLDPEDRAAGYILPCVTWPTGDVVLDA